MKKFAIASALVALAAGLAVAQTDPIATRENTMKGLGKSWDGQVDKMVKGSLPYDQKAVDDSLRKIVAAAKFMPTLFPDNSKTGEKTRALPAIWENKDDLDARFKKIGDLAASYEGKITNLATLKAAYDGVDKTCEDCHDKYRARRR